jgi:hypothetical protein
MFVTIDFWQCSTLLAQGVGDLLLRGILWRICLARRLAPPGVALAPGDDSSGGVSSPASGRLAARACCGCPMQP